MAEALPRNFAQRAGEALQLRSTTIGAGLEPGAGRATRLAKLPAIMVPIVTSSEGADLVGDG